MRDEEILRDILFVLFLVTVTALAFVYFTIPEREIFIEKQLQWWSEFREVLRSVM